MSRIVHSIEYLSQSIMILHIMYIDQIVKTIEAMNIVNEKMFSAVLSVFMYSIGSMTTINAISATRQKR